MGTDTDTDTLHSEILAYSAQLLKKVSSMVLLVRDVSQTARGNDDIALDDELNSLSRLIGDVRRLVGWRKESVDLLEASYRSTSRVMGTDRGAK